MGKPTLSAHLDVVFQHLASPILKQALPLLGSENAATKVRRMLLRIQAVLSDAEELQVKDEAVRSWLWDLRDVIYDADDLFDELTTRILQLKAEHDLAIDGDQVSGSLTKPCSDLIPFDFSSKINEIGEKLDEIAKESIALHLKEMFGMSRIVVKERSAAAGLLVDESRIFGREVDKENVIKLLVASESKRNEFDVVPIVGMGGLGKTTLAQLVLKDERVEKHFRLRIWVTVSEDSDARRLTKAIIESATGDKYLLLGLEAMQRNLRSILSGKRYLLILDDVRNEICSEWEKLQVPLTSGAKGSKVLMTTMSEMVAQILGSVPPYQLKGLSDGDCWSLFSIYAFGDGNEDVNPNMGMIGKEIVKKCKGLPLAVKVLGSLLHGKDEYKWRHILKNQVWKFPVNNNGLFPVLSLSYLFLPMHLKQCFMYCSMLPKNAKFGKDLLIRLWMAQGFILAKGGQRIEDLAAEYFEDLLWRSLLQYSHFDYENDEPKFMMHEVIRDFAQFVSGNECFLMHCGNSLDISNGARHLSVNCDTLEALSLKAFNESQGLRTFLLAGECKMRELQVPNDLLLNLKCLRVLDLSNTSLHVLPDSVGHLIHLRYLSLVSTQIERLPESLSGLYNLQTLDLGDCFELKVLPKGIKNLYNLRHLNLQLHQCRVSGLSSFPTGFGQLTSLQTLSTFVVGSTGECRIGELKGLTDLQGHLCISKLDNVVGEDEAKEADLKNKQYICNLEFQWHSASKVDGSVDERVLKSLQPHSNLKELAFKGYGGSLFPSWMGDSSFTNLVTLNLSDCVNCHLLPPLGQLPSLKYLSLERVAVKHIRREFYGNGKVTSFPSLETLKFESLPQWEEWTGVEEYDMLCLQELFLIACSQLKTLPRALSSLKKLDMWNCFGLTSLPRLPSLRSLVLRCPTSTLLQHLNNLTSLEHLEIKNCPELVSLPRDLRNLPSLKDLIIHDCKQLSSFPDGLKNLTTLEYLEISGCPQLQLFPKEGLPSNLQFLSISNCPLLRQRCQNNGGEDWNKMVHIYSVCIDGHKVSFSEELTPLPTTRNL